MGKIFVFSINKTFDVLLKTPEINKWCGLLCSYRTNGYEDFRKLYDQIKIFRDDYTF